MGQEHRVTRYESARVSSYATMELHGWPEVFIGCGCGLGLLYPDGINACWRCKFCHWWGYLHRINGQLTQSKLAAVD